jgi:hypothetical protein
VSVSADASALFLWIIFVEAEQRAFALSVCFLLPVCETRLSVVVARPTKEFTTEKQFPWGQV